MTITADGVQGAFSIRYNFVAGSDPSYTATGNLGSLKITRKDYQTEGHWIFAMFFIESK